MTEKTSIPLYFCSLTERPQALESLRMLHDQTWNNYLPPSESRHFAPRFVSEFGDFISLAFENKECEKLLAYSASIPFHGPEKLEDLPDSGYDGAIIDAFDRLDRGAWNPNMLCSLAMAIESTQRGQNLSKKMAEGFKELAQKHGFRHLVLPLRPPAKAQHAFMSMEDYAEQLDSDGKPRDYWIRLHCELGAQLVKVCHRSMVRSYDIETWESVTGLSFPTSGTYEVPHALVPLTIDRSRNMGSMIEPNLWVHYRVD